MGQPIYNSVRASAFASKQNYSSKGIHQVFTQREVHHDLKSINIDLREARDSKNHPNSLPIIIALDVTGSMGDIPHKMIAEDLNKMMKRLIEAGINDTQVMFMAVGDHKCDDAPLQISQFESDDESLDKWLRQIWIEGNGGGNGGESYMLPWFFAAKKTSLDSFEKRGQKGFLFTIGDEPVHGTLPRSAQEQLFRAGENDLSSLELFAEAEKTYHVFHIHMKQGWNGSRESVINGWKELIGDKLLIAKSRSDAPTLIANKVLELLKTPVKVETKTEIEEEVQDEKPEIKITL